MRVVVSAHLSNKTAVEGEGLVRCQSAVLVVVCARTACVLYQFSSETLRPFHVLTRHTLSRTAVGSDHQ